jgi:hypothetical protein
VNDRETQVAPANILHKVETDLRLPDRFVLDLVEEDDWSFTIKAHALLEAAVTQVLTTAVPDTRLHKLLTSLNLAGRHSKLSYAEALNLLEDTHIRFLNQLSQIRNTIVHDISQVSFTYRDYLAGLQPEARRTLLSNLLFMGGGQDAAAQTRFENSAKIILWAHIVAVLGHCVAQQARSEARAAIENEKGALAQSILRTVKESS